MDEGARMLLGSMGLLSEAISVVRISEGGVMRP